MEKFLELLSPLNLSIYAIITIVILVGAICNIDNLLLLKSAIQNLFVKFSSACRKGSISNSARGKILKASNRVCKDISKEILVNDLKIEWVKTEDAEAFIKNNQVIIRIDNNSNPHKTYVRTVTAFVGQALLPKAKRVIDQDIYKASKLSVARSFILNSDVEALDYFDNEILKPAVDSNLRLGELLNDIKIIDGNGMFYRILLSEYSKAASMIYKDIVIDQCFIMETREFLRYLHRIAVGGVDNPDEFVFNREYFKVNIFLATKDITYQKYGIKSYLKNIVKAVNNGVETIYIFGLGKKIEIAKELAEEAKESDFRIDSVKHYMYKHKSLNDGSNINGVCSVLQVYKER